MKHLEKLTRKHLGEILVDEGLISKSQLVDAEREHVRSGDPLGSILVEANYISDWDLAKTVATQYQLPFVELAKMGISSEAGELFRPEEQQKHRIVPIDRMGSVLTLAVSDMPDIEFLREIRDRTGFTPFLFVVLLTEIQKHLLDENPPAVPAAVPEAAAAPAGPEAELTLIPPDEDWEPDLSVLNDPMDGADEDEEEDLLSPEQMDGWQSIFDTGNESVLKDIE